jgi:hypothetical protein
MWTCQQTSKLYGGSIKTTLTISSVTSATTNPSPSAPTPSSPPTSARPSSTPATASPTSPPPARPTCSSPKRATTSSPTARARTCLSPSSRTGAPSSPPSRRLWPASRLCRRLLSRATRTSRLVGLVCRMFAECCYRSFWVDDVMDRIHDRRCINVLHDFRYVVFLIGSQMLYAVLPYTAVLSYLHDSGERALPEPHSLTGPQMPMRCYLTRQYRITLIVPPVRGHFQSHSLSLTKGYPRGNIFYLSMGTTT